MTDAAAHAAANAAQLRLLREALISLPTAAAVADTPLDSSASLPSEGDPASDQATLPTSTAPVQESIQPDPNTKDAPACCPSSAGRT
ncbi:hypothetical protein ACFFLM_20450 [Deinococcus oregonensis]|uniref:Uncharacterized protein n=1 Tax=Deinococcus oregonensis TaxID=1805970 RepID=A0ABV6B3I6_9DEIO